MKKTFSIVLFFISLNVIASTIAFALEATYTYDKLGRLTAVVYQESANNTSLNYEYDALGNILMHSVTTNNTSAGTIIVNPDPHALAAPWQLTGPNSYSLSGVGSTTVQNLAAGSYTLTWGDLANWTKPAPETQALSTGSTVVFTGTYLPLPYINPSTSTTSVLTGHEITLNGTNFGSSMGTGYVTFGNGLRVPAGNIRSWTNNQIILTVPAGAQSGCLLVTNAQGTTSGCFNITITPDPQHYIAPVGHVFFDNNGLLCTDDDFNAMPTSPPYAGYQGYEYMSVYGGVLYLSPPNPGTHVSLMMPNTPATISNSALIVNYQGGPPPIGYSFSLVIRNEFGAVADLGIGTVSTGSGIGAADDTHNMETGQSYGFEWLSGYTSLGMMIEVGDTGLVRASYMLNPADGSLAYDDPRWQTLATWQSTVDRTNMNVMISTGSTGSFPGDFTEDSDVDGSDLAALIASPGLLDIATFAANFGKGGN